MKKNLLLSAAALSIGFAVNAQTFEGVEAECPKVENGTITIDGIADDGYSESINFLGFNEANVPDNEDDLSGSYKFAWSEEGLYLLVSINDDVYDLAEEDDWTQSLYKYDNVEVFFNTDLTNDAEDGARQPEDKQLRYSVGYTDDAQNLSSDIIEGNEWKFVLEDGSYVLETFIPWVGVTAEGFTLGLESQIGFTINVGDSDLAGGNRDLIMLWAGAGGVDEQWKNTLLYGLVTLTESTVGINENIAKESLDVYPNPAKNTINISNADSDIMIYNTIGKEVMTISATESTIDISKLEAGVYVFQSANKVCRVVID